MSTFEITMERKTGDHWPVVVERTSPGASLRLRLLAGDKTRSLDASGGEKLASPARSVFSSRLQDGAYENGGTEVCIFRLTEALKYNHIVII